jgi:hypothetical protein
MATKQSILLGAHDEASLKSQLGGTFKRELPNAVWQRHEDHFTYAIPDISITFAGFTTWLEGKVLDPKLKSRHIQEVQLLKLSNQGRGWYIIWDLRDLLAPQPLTRIVHPMWVMNRKVLETLAHDERTYTGVDHRAVVEFIRSTHTP